MGKYLNDELKKITEEKTFSYMKLVDGKNRFMLLEDYISVFCKNYETQKDKTKPHYSKTKNDYHSELIFFAIVLDLSDNSIKQLEVRPKTLIAMIDEQSEGADLENVINVINKIRKNDKVSYTFNIDIKIHKELIELVNSAKVDYVFNLDNLYSTERYIVETDLPF